VQELAKWTREVSETRIIAGIGRTPREIFETEERQAMLSLPATRWDPVSWGRVKVDKDFLIQFEKAFYSVPYQYIGAKVIVFGSRHSVRIYLEAVEIARQDRAKRQWDIVRNPLHAPPHMEEYMNTTSAGLLRWAARMGETVGLVAESILADKAVDGMRPVRALIRLATTYPPERVQRACARALRYDTATYRSVKEILEKNLDRLPADDPIEPSGQRVFRFQRQGQDFDPEVLRVSQN